MSALTDRLRRLADEAGEGDPLLLRDAALEAATALETAEARPAVAEALREAAARIAGMPEGTTAKGAARKLRQFADRA